MLDELEKVAKQFDYVRFGHRDYAPLGSVSVTSIKREFGGWSAALDALNEHLQTKNLELKPRPHSPNRIYSDQELFDEMGKVWDSLGYRPSRQDWEQSGSTISVNTYKKRFGGWANACLQFLEYKMGKKVVVADKAQPTLAASSKGHKPTTKKQSRDISLSLRLKVLQRDKFRCVYCGRSPANTSGSVLHIDHKHPYSKGGANTLENLQTLCQDCNLGKMDKIVKVKPSTAPYTSAPIPEVFLQIDGKGANNTFTGHVSGKSGQMLVAESIEIMGEKTVLDQQFSKLFFLENLNFPADVFIEKVDSVPVKLTYRTLDGQRFEYIIEGTQQPMAIGKYNVNFEKPARIERL